MFGLHKIPHPGNFEFIDRVVGTRASVSDRKAHAALELTVQDLGEEVFRLTLARSNSSAGPRLARLSFTGARRSTYRARLGARGEFELGRGRGKAGSMLSGPAGGFIGLSGEAWMLRLASDAKDRFFGMGEKWGRLEKSGLKSQFWNTDVWADYAPEQIGRAEVDAAYASIPYLVIERAGVFFGVLLDTTRRAFMATNPVLSLTGEDPFGAGSGRRARSGAGQLYLGAFNGPVQAYFLVGPSLRELTRKLQRLVGTTPRPPLWALGHHQSRWGYGDRADLLELDRKFAEHGIPCDGLWLDIDYMDGFRVFTTRKGAIPEVGGRFDWGPLGARRRRVVPILDPGVKVDPGYTVYDDGLAGGHFCLGPTGRPYVGIVWPGEVHFPDFSQGKTRKFWAGEVQSFAHKGFDAFWIDMNDPSTGPVEGTSMLFAGGRAPHEAFHNEYALGMAQATQAGLLGARPNERPFVLSRSASLGMARHAAVWTGDNVSSFRHLAVAVSTSINLALSGVPFNGPDVPGFGGDATDELAIRFYQAAFLFPFLRNHSVKGSRPQEPWAFSPKTVRILRHFIRLRYRFLPYLYQLFIAQEQHGEPILGPTFLDEASLPDAHMREDQFLVGNLLCAPVAIEGVTEREVRLPDGDWYCLQTGLWERGGRIVRRRVPLSSTPVFVRSGTILPLAAEERVLAADGGAPPLEERLCYVDFHVFVRGSQRAVLDYVLDDGESLDYRRGAERHLRVVAEASRGRLDLGVELTKAPKERSRGALGLLHGRFVVHGAEKTRVRTPLTSSWQSASEHLSAGTLPVRRSGRFSS